MVTDDMGISWDFHQWGYPIAGWFTRGNAIRMDDDWQYPYDLGKPHM